MRSEARRCILCGSTDVRDVSSQADIRYFPEDEFSVVKCAECGTLCTLPPQSEVSIQKYYPLDYGAYVSREDVHRVFEGPRGQTPAKELAYYRDLRTELVGAGSERVAAWWRDTLARVRSDVHGISATQWYLYALPLREDATTRVLYVGSGTPRRFLGYSQVPDLLLETLDISEEMCRAYRDVGLQAQQGTVSSMPVPKAGYDVIFSSHVVEHFLRPRQELRLLAEWLAPDGIMVCAPDYGSLEWRVKPVYYDVPRHQVHLDHKAARRMFAAAGLRVLKRIHTPYGYGFFQSRFLERYQKDPAHFDPSSFAEPLARWMRVVSSVLAFIGQSGNVIYYLGKAE